MKGYKFISAILAAFLLCGSYGAAIPKYDKFLKDVVDSSCRGQIGIYRTGKDKIYLEFDKKNLGRRMLVGSTLSSASDPASLDVGYKYSTPLCLRVELIDSMVTLFESSAGATTRDSLMRLAIKRNYTPNLYSRIPLAAYNSDSSKLIFEITPIINSLNPKGNGFSVVKSADAKSLYYGRIRSYSDNASIVVNNKVEFSRAVFMAKIKTGEGTISSNISFLLLPEEMMRPRISDPRIGVFSTGGINRRQKVDLSSAEDGLKMYSVANRWRIEPVDIKAWKRGKTVAVKKPIVWYIDNTFPALWKRPIREGVLAWNKAFEKIGLKDVMQVRDFPTIEEDPEFDPDNLKYSCIRYVPNAAMNAFGPSWVDPVSGEILNASVIVYNDIVRLINNWRFVQTAQVDKRARSKKMPDDLITESIVYVISHEIGHTLGLMHNMGASSAFPVDSLRSPSFTKRYGTTPSIMDYARFNYVAQRGDKGVKLTPPAIGVYDDYVIEWLYKPVINAKDMWEEAEAAKKIIDSKEGNPLYRYGPQQFNKDKKLQQDPSALAEDLGDDPIKASDYGIENLKYILPNISVWIKDDDDYSHRKALYSQTAKQYYRYLDNVLAQVGGVRLYRVRADKGQSPAVPLSAAVQKSSLKWTVNQLKNSSWLEDKTLRENIGLHIPYMVKITEMIADKLTNEVPRKVEISSYAALNGSAYSLSDYYDDIYNEIFEFSEDISEPMNNLQRNITEKLVKNFIAVKSKGVASNGDLAAYECRMLSKIKTLSSLRRTSSSGRAAANYEYLYYITSNALGEK